mmetsp:Transcript_3661/g.8243  ORF Transcript_3661/g.8243 Transcript_3661/m.8243 type:complete len:337 (-) Transcript_3661:1466-2476(-)|eukprot:scaffold69074_cov60-Phaeocystis_antarctica.AAC.4
MRLPLGSQPSLLVAAPTRVLLVLPRCVRRERRRGRHGRPDEAVVGVVGRAARRRRRTTVGGPRRVGVAVQAGAAARCAVGTAVGTAVGAVARDAVAVALLLRVVEVRLVLVVVREDPPPRKALPPRRAEALRRPGAAARARVFELLVLLVAQKNTLERVYVVEAGERVDERVGQVRDERLDVISPDELKQLEDGRVHQVVARAVAQELREHRLEALVLDDVTVVELVLQADAGAEEAQRGKHQALVAAPRQPQHLGEHVVAQDEVLDAIRVLLHAERQQLADVLLCREHAVPAPAHVLLHLRLGLRVAVHGRRAGLRPAGDGPRELVHELVVEEVE